VCDAIPPVETALRVHVLIHRGEQHKPSSTGTLIVRAVAGVTCHVYQRANRLLTASGFRLDTLEPGRPLWILHPTGEPMPARPTPANGSPSPHVLLLDGTWRQAGEMLRTVAGKGQCVSLPEPAAKPGRYWLRDQPKPEHLSTAEALMGVFHALGDTRAEECLRLHFELHVYATLLARGRREMAERYLGCSPLLSQMPHLLDRFA
jgi:hypothetical protein